MTRIAKPQIKDAALLANLAKVTFIESHGSSAKEEDIAAYVDEKYTENIFTEELQNPENHYRIIYEGEKPAGFSKLVFNTVVPDSDLQNMAKLDRIYILKEFYSLGLGKKLFEYNVQLGQEAGQLGIWLHVWKGNERAISFYQKAGFKIIGSYDFKISETHYNPNHRMLLIF